ncbi:uncharacterized protein LOC114536338 [Dendronephthya gigantea]|uniref:uncharacterized protein LOC114536338 n=1 Tax=Dendronephthya gigantea TaxID=151771 RepID=UPI00106ADDE4|nr:uncharacterized protein LOC114536338 [Dendronephthya gigantea]
MHQDVNTNSRGSLLNKMEVESDSDVPEFSLPPKSIVKRPKKTIRRRTRSRWRKCCKTYCRYCGVVLLALVLCACIMAIALLSWSSFRLSREVENLTRRLTIEINLVKTEQMTNVQKCESIEKRMQENMKVLENGQKDIKEFKKKLQMSYAKITSLNGSLLRISHMLHGPNGKVTLGHTVNALKKGMADTGAEITKLSDEIKQLNKKASSQNRALKRIVLGMFNISSEIANITGKSSKSFPDSQDYLQQEFNEQNNFVEEKCNHSLKNSEVYDVIDTLNKSLSEQVEHLLKIKPGLTNTHNEDVVDISADISRVQRDMSVINRLITKLNMQVRNLTQSNTNSYEINNQIQLLWGELELQNQSIIQIQNLVEQNTEFKPGVSSRRRVELKQESLPENDGEIFPKDRQSDANEQKRDTLRTRFKKLNSNSEKKYSHKLRDLIDDNVQLI